MRDPRNWVRPAAAAVVGARRRNRAGGAAGPPSPPLAQAAVLEPARARRAHASRRRRRSAPDPARPLSPQPCGLPRTPAASVSPMAVCYRHPSRETGVSCSSCGRPICPDCMTPTPVGMRCPECSRDRTKVKTIRTAPSTPIVTQALIVINVIAFIAETAAGASLGGNGARLDLQPRSAVRPGDRPPASVLADRHRRVPARRPAPHRRQHAVAVLRRPGARAGDRVAQLRASSTSPRCSRARSARSCSSRRRSRSAHRARSSACSAR